MADGGLDPVLLGAAAGAAKLVASFMKGDIKPCTMRVQWTGMPFLSDRVGLHPKTDGTFHMRLISKGPIRVAREWLNRG